jgi:hypothetical protein
MYDGTTFYNTYKANADNTSEREYPLFADTANRIWSSTDLGASAISSINLLGTDYKGDAGKNFLVFSNFDTVAGVEKIAFSGTVLFKPLVSGQKIVIEYATGELSSSTSWTSLGEASYSVDGGTVTNKTFLFPVGTVFNKMWFRVKLEGGGSNTPKLQDFVMEYLPMPTYKKNWTININASDSIRALDGSLSEKTGRELRSMIEAAWWTKSVLDYQDLDYATTILSDNPLSAAGTTVTVPENGTRDFPEQGRIKIGDEEIFYTGKTPTTFTGCTRGARGTRAVSHALSSIINNAYKVLITNCQSSVPVALNGRELEYIVSLTLREV